MRSASPSAETAPTATTTATTTATPTAVEDHLATVLASVIALPSEAVTLADAVGRTVAEPVHARVDVPLFDNSAMDGFAVRHPDVATASAEHPVTLRVIADVPAGSVESPVLHAGEAVRIMTGAPVPPTATAVVPFEHTRDGLDGSAVSTLIGPPPKREGAHIRRRGEEVRAGDLLAATGIPIGPLHAAAFATAGVERVIVHRRPRVAIISTGSELVAPGAAFGPGQIPDSNSALLRALCTDAGAEVVSIETVTDRDDEFAAALDRAVVGGRADAVITSGGVSAGDHEVVRNVLRDRIAFVSVAMQPGRPQAFGRIGDALVFGLPGNPVSVAVSFEAFVRPAILALQGRTMLQRPVLRIAAASGWNAAPGRRQYVPATVDRSDPDAWSVRPAGAGPHIAAGLARADAYVVVPAHVSEVAAGDLVDVMLLT